MYFGFSQALLGVSGFESSSNYIEEQMPGVFPRTLRNMWAITGLLNTILSILMVLLIRVTELYVPAGTSLALSSLTTTGLNSI